MSLVGPFVLSSFRRFIDMCTRVRPFLTLFLCGLLSLGHIPAWIHFVEFHGAEQFETFSEADVGHCEHFHSTCRVVVTKSEPKNVQPARELRDVTSLTIREVDIESHDEEHCILCQSLVHSVSALGPDANAEMLAESSYFSVLTQCHFCLKSAYSIQQPRGPPVVA